MFVNRKVQLQAEQRKAVKMRSSDDEEYLISGGRGRVQGRGRGWGRRRELGVPELLEEEAELEVGVPKVQQETS